MSSDPHTSDRPKNHLADETSPYLLQHVYNPVDWHPWNAETLAKAQEENKMMIISIGYAACHWCHVMEHESFEDSTIAAIMNEHFLPVKVDREERPDVDDVYMTACQLSSQRGCGWPLNAFALPDGRPFWAGTYFPPAEWKQILEHFSTMYQEDRASLDTAAAKLTAGVQASEELIHTEDAQIISSASMLSLRDQYLALEDKTWGGRRGSPKFPMPDNYLFLLRSNYTQPSAEIDRYIQLALDRMAWGGIYDQLGGGWARYSVDDRWHVPHFEKMLYDNGQLIRLYSEAYKKYAKPLYAEKIRQTIDWLDREMTAREGAFYSSLDADSEGEEGSYYVWTADALSESLGDDYTEFKKYYSIQQRGNWEHDKNVLMQKQSHDDLASALHLEPKELAQRMAAARKLLLKQRSQRPRPRTDDKILTSWNALMIDGLCAAYEALGDDSYREKARTALDFLLAHQVDDTGHVWRNYKEGKSSISGFLDDYALLARACISMYQISFEERYLQYAQTLVDYVIEHFSDDSSPMYYYTSMLDDPLISRKKVTSDNVIPSSNAILANVLYDLGDYYGLSVYTDEARSMAETISPAIEQSGVPHYWSHWLQLLHRQNNPPKEIAIVGPHVEEIRRQLQSDYYPALYCGSRADSQLPLLEDKYVEGATYIYVCQNKVCKLPTEDVDQARALIRDEI